MLSILLGLGSACATDCTLIGCLNGLFIDFDKPAAYPYRVELSTGMAADQAFVQDCPSSPRCNPSAAWFPDYFPSVVTVKVTTPAGTVTGQVEPQYQDHYPNGKRCGSACRNAHVAVTIP